jgi:hypothetical protein
MNGTEEQDTATRNGKKEATRNRAPRTTSTVERVVSRNTGSKTAHSRAALRTLLQPYRDSGQTKPDGRLEVINEMVMGGEQLGSLVDKMSIGGGKEVRNVGSESS